jgi:protein SCO1/2
VSLHLRFVLPALSALLATALILAIVLSGSHGSAPVASPNQSGAFDGAAFPGGVVAHDFTLTDQYGRKLSLSSYRGQVVALVFLAPDCRTCVLVAQQVRGALDELGPRPGVRTVFVSTQAGALRARAGHLLAETTLTGRVEYLTGTAHELRPVWHAYSIAPVSAGKAASEAGITVLLIDRKGVERVGFGLEQITPEGLTHDIRLLQAG